MEPVAKPSAQGRSEIFPALNRFLTPEENVRSAGGQLRAGTTPSRVAPEPPLFFSVSGSPIFREEPKKIDLTSVPLWASSIVRRGELKVRGPVARVGIIRGGKGGAAGPLFPSRGRLGYMFVGPRFPVFQTNRESRRGPND